jgi:dATP pyrophosphohydrolase
MLPVKSFSVSIFILKPEGDEIKVLLMRRTGYLAGLWCQVAGGIEPGEKAWQTAIREVMEETRIELTEIWSADILEQFYEPDKECITLVPVFVSTVPEDTKVVLNDEHDAYKWASIDEAYELFGFPGQQRALATIKAEFIDKKPNPHLRIRIST